MSQADAVNGMLLHGVHEGDLQRERQRLARVRLPSLHYPRMPEPSACLGVETQGSCELDMVVAWRGRRSKS